MTLRLVLLPFALLCLLPGSAQARCRAICECGTANSAVVVGTVTEQANPDGGQPGRGLRVDRVFGQPDASTPVVGSFLPTLQGTGEAIVSLTTGAVEPVTDGGVTCNNVRLTVDAYAAMQLSDSCAPLSDRGFVQPPCKDTSPGCGSSPLAPSAIALFVAVALAFRRRARRSSTARCA